MRIYPICNLSMPSLTRHARRLFQVCVAVTLCLDAAATVRYGNILNMGNMTVFYVPKALQHDQTASLNQGQVVVELDSSTTYTGLERFTLATKWRSLWYDDQPKSSADAYRLSNDLYYRMTAHMALGVGVDIYKEAGYVDMLGPRQGYQYALSARWRW